jgi:peptide/nickel transport system substrate-binding protein
VKLIRCLSAIALAQGMLLSPISAEISPIEPPIFVKKVGLGKLPPIADRLPKAPLVVSKIYKGWTEGRYGGSLNMLMSRSKDVRLVVVYGYARLVGFTPDYQLKADILMKYTVEEGRRFTLHLRPGHRWSNGQPFTAEDFRYYWEDVANNPKLSPLGPPKRLLVNGKKPLFEVIDETTIRYTWAAANPDFLPALAGARPLYIYRPAHYLRPLHKNYADPQKLRKRVKKSGRRNWAALHNKRDDQYRFNNPKLPTLQPWVATTRPPAERFVFRRNPFFHRIDKNGRQLPYIDQAVVNIAAAQIIPGKTGAGESDLQARYLKFSDYTFLKKGEELNRYKVRLWRSAKGSHLALFPNLNVNDKTWRKLFRNVNFRRALSLAIDRREINQVVYFGLTHEGNNTVLPQSPLYKADYSKRWAGFDLKKANALLDRLGLTKRNDDGFRLLPDGRPMEIIVETPGEDTEQTDVLELIHDTWRKIGIKLYNRPSQREIFRNRVFAGETLISVWSGYENGLPTADISPQELAPTSQQQLQWPKWGQYFQSGGSVGEAPVIPEAKNLMSMYQDWRNTSDTKTREQIWHDMLAIHADQVFSIGVVAGVPQPVITNKNLRNVPKDAVYNWNPGAHFGIMHPDSFWFAKQ